MDTDQELKRTSADRSTSIAKGIAGSFPVVGPLIAEVVGALIPNQRIDRLSRFVAVLNDKVEGLEKSWVEARFGDEKFVDLLEDSFHQASRALTSERLSYIGELIKTSLSEGELDHAQGKVLLSLLNQLSDAEIILLQFYAKRTSGDRGEYLEKHEGIIRGPVAFSRPSHEELDKAAIHKTYKAHLHQLDLIKPHFKRPKRGEFPEFDKDTGMVKVSSYKITWLGRLLLRFIGLDDGLDRG